MNSTKSIGLTKNIVAAIMLLAAAAASSAGMLDAEGPRKDGHEVALREWNSAKQQEWRAAQERDSRPSREVAQERSAPAPRAEPATPKTTYLMEPNGGYTVVQSNAGGTTVTTHRLDGKVQDVVKSSMPRHAEYVAMQQRGGAEVISLTRAMHDYDVHDYDF